MAQTFLNLAQGVTGTLPSANNSAKILQVISDTKTDTQTISGSSYVEISGLSVAITPSSASSKILIITSITFGTNQDAYPSFQLRRGGSNIFIASGTQTGEETTFSSHADARSQYRMANAGHHFLDSPNSTSQQTYSVYCSPMRTETQALKINTAYSISDDNQGLGTSVITCFEISS